MARTVRMRPHTILIIAIIVIIILLIAVNLIFGGINRIATAENEMGNLHALFLLEDEREIVSAQFLILNVRTKRAALLDLPPYLGVIIDRTDNLDRIDTLIAENNFSEYIAEIETFTNTEIDFHLRWSIEDFTALIDLLEGVRLFIISSPSDTQPFPSGDVVLDGRKTAEYISLYRNETDNKLRAEGLQELIYRTMLALSKNKEYLEHKDVINYVKRIVRTNLPKNELRTLLTDILHGIDEESVQIWLSQGDIRSVTVEDRRESLLFPDLETQWMAQTVAQIENQMVSRQVRRVGSNEVRMEILNGTTTSGLARRTKLLYEQFGYTIVRVGNHQDSVPITQLINYGVTPNVAEGVAAVINMDIERIQQSVEQLIEEYDLTLIIGEDFDGVTVR